MGINGTVLTLAVWYPRVKTEAQALECFYKGRDWLIRNPNDPDCGRYCSFRDSEVGDQVTLHYNKNRDAVTFTVQGIEKGG